MHTSFALMHELTVCPPGEEKERVQIFVKTVVLAQTRRCRYGSTPGEQRQRRGLGRAPPQRIDVRRAGSRLGGSQDPAHARARLWNSPGVPSTRIIIQHSSHGRSRYDSTAGEQPQGISPPTCPSVRQPASSFSTPPMSVIRRREQLPALLRVVLSPGA